MSDKELEEIETLEIDFKDIDELELALEVSSKKAIYLIDDLIKHLFESQLENQKYKEVIDKAIEKEEIMYLANKVAITTQNIEIKAIRDRLEEIFKILKEEKSI